MSTVKTSSGFIVLSNGAEVFYEQSGTGSGRTLLCLPASLGSGRSCFAYTLDVFSEYFNVVTYDPRGYGKSRETKREFSPSMYHQDACDAAEVMKKLGYEKYYVVGVRAGAIIALILAGKYPSRVEKLISFAGMAFISKEGVDVLDAWMSDIQAYDTLLQPLFDIYGKERCIKIFEEALSNERAISERPGGDVCTSEVKAIACPTLILHAERDPFVARCHADFLHEKIPNSMFHIVPNEDHMWPITGSEEFHRLLKEFLEGNFSRDAEK